MVVRIRGDSGRVSVDRIVKMAVVMFVVLVKCQCFIWFVELGGNVIVE